MNTATPPSGTRARRRVLARVVFFACLAATGLAVGTYFAVHTAVYAGSFGEVPTAQQLANVTTAEATRVLSRDGQQLGKYFLTERVHVAADEVSPNVIDALVATEDARFFSHHGYDLEAWARVLFKTVIGGDEGSGGGSTITQQLVKNLYGRERVFDDPTLSLVANKLREVFVACDLEAVHSKRDILTLYLNTVAFPDNTYGIGVAARRHFNKSAAELSVEEAATLVGALKATYTYDPVRHPAAALARRNTVLGLMAQQGFLDVRTRDSLRALPVRIDYHRDEHNAGLATHLREHARLELKSLLAEINEARGTEYDLYSDGLEVHTTVDAGMQAHAERAVRTHLAQLQEQFYGSLRAGERAWEVEQTYTDAYRGCQRVRGMRAAGFGDSYIDSVMHAPRSMRLYDYRTASAKTEELSPADSIAYALGILNAGFLAVEPGTGAIRAWVGGANHEFFKYDKVTSRRSVGSTFKPIVYAAALRQNVDPTRYWGNYRRTYWRYEGWSPRNAGDEYGGAYNMQGGLTNSLNTVSVQLMMATGPRRVVELARELGITSDLPAVPAIALGAGDVSLREMVQAYGTFANRGERADLHYVERIVDRAGEVLYEAAEAHAAPRRVLTTDEADLIRGMLESVVDDGTGRRLRWRYKLEGAIAGKTGTSQNHSDGWFIGFTPRLVAGAWTGAESPAVRFRDIKFGQGAHMALPIWGEFMSALRDDPRYASYLGGSFAEPSDYVAEVLRQPMRYVAPKAAELPGPAVAKAASSPPTATTKTPPPTLPTLPSRAVEVANFTIPVADRAVDADLR